MGRFCDDPFLGDYVDRGPDSRGVLDLLTSGEIEERFAPVYLRGNHDVMPLSAIRGHVDANELRVWLGASGGAETLESYGVDLRRQGPDRFLRDFAERLPKAHADFTVLNPLSPFVRSHAMRRGGVVLEMDVESVAPLDRAVIRGLVRSLCRARRPEEAKRDWEGTVVAIKRNESRLGTESEGTTDGDSDDGSGAAPSAEETPSGGGADDRRLKVKFAPGAFDALFESNERESRFTAEVLRSLDPIERRAVIEEADEP